MTYREALAWLFNTQLFGIKLGLENIQRLLAALGISRNGDFQIADGGSEAAAPCRIIHVAGTNGKGSVCAMITAICRAGGYRTGLFTSPHLVTFRERIQVDGEMIGETGVAEGLTRIRDLVREWDPHPTFFEIVTALGLLQFRDSACEIVVLETGMGGRLDATNAVTPVVSVITPIDLDHQKWLGETLAEIAAEKAGIIKPGIPVVSAPQLPEAEAVLQARAIELSAPLEIIEGEFLDAAVALPGTYQRENAALAIAALRAGRIEVNDADIRSGLTNVVWPARFQIWDGSIVIDGAHNPAGAATLVQTWREKFGDEPATLILGIFADKDAAAIYRALLPITAYVVLTNFEGGRVLPAAELAAIITSVTPEMPHAIAHTPAEALHLARATGRRVFVAGSLHLAGEVLAILQGQPAAFDECAQ